MSSEATQDAEIGGGELTRQIAAALADERRLSLVSLLAERDHPLSERDLAVEVAASTSDRRPGDVTAREREEIGRALYHQHLPVLEAAGLVVRYRDLGMVAATDHPILETVDVASEATAETWSIAEAMLEQPRRQHALAVLAEAASPVAFEDLVAEVAARQHRTADREPTPDEIRRIRTGLHHAGLPRLESAGLLAVDRDRETVEYRGDADVERLVDAVAPALLPVATE